MATAAPAKMAAHDTADRLDPAAIGTGSIATLVISTAMACSPYSVVRAHGKQQNHRKWNAQ
jgi:hypothetical protein